MRKPRQTCSKSPLKQGERNTKSICLCNLPIWDFLYACIYFVMDSTGLQFSVKSIHCHSEMSCAVMAKVYQTVLKNTNSGEFITVFYNPMSVLSISTK